MQELSPRSIKSNENEKEQLEKQISYYRQQLQLQKKKLDLLNTDSNAAPSHTATTRDPRLVKASNNDNSSPTSTRTKSSLYSQTSKSRSSSLSSSLSPSSTPSPTPSPPSKRQAISPSANSNLTNGQRSSIIKQNLNMNNHTSSSNSLKRPSPTLHGSQAQNENVKKAKMSANTMQRDPANTNAKSNISMNKVNLSAKASSVESATTILVNKAQVAIVKGASLSTKQASRALPSLSLTKSANNKLAKMSKVTQSNAQKVLIMKTSKSESNVKSLEEMKMNDEEQMDEDWASEEKPKTTCLNLVAKKIPSLFDIDPLISIPQLNQILQTSSQIQKSKTTSSIVDPSSSITPSKTPNSNAKTISNNNNNNNNSNKPLATQTQATKTTTEIKANIPKSNSNKKSLNKTHQDKHQDKHQEKQQTKLSKSEEISENVFGDVDERFTTNQASSTLSSTLSSSLSSLIKTTGQKEPVKLNIDLNLVKSLLQNPILDQVKQIMQQSLQTVSKTNPPVSPPLIKTNDTSTLISKQIVEPQNDKTINVQTVQESKPKQVQVEQEKLVEKPNVILPSLKQVQEQQETFDESESQNENQNENQSESQSENQNEYVSYDDLPPIKPKDMNENQNDSLLIIDARSYRIQPDIRRIIKIYYHDHEIFCDTRTKDVYVDQKRVSKMGDPTKEIMLNGRRVRLMYMGKRIELWIDGVSFHFRADSPPKQISLNSSHSNQLKRFYVTIDSRTMDMYFNNYKVCNINGGPYGSGASSVMSRLSPDDFEQHEISFVCPPKRIMIDGAPRKMRYDLAVPCIEMVNGLFHVIRFSGPPKDIYIDDQPYKVPFDKTVRIKLNGRAHELAWGGPGFEVIIDGRPYELQFNKPAREIIVGTRPHFIYICGDAPDVKICGRLPKELTQEANLNVQVKQQQPAVKPPPLMTQNLAMPTNPAIVRAIASQSPQPLNTSPLSNVNELLKKLVQHKILPNSTSSDERQTSKSRQPKEEEAKVPDLSSLDSDLLKQKYTSAIKSLYNGVQCAQCGNRFNQHETSTTVSSNGGSVSSRYARHLDWHFRQNKKEKDEINKAHSRAWYYTLQDWILFEEISEDQLLNQDMASSQDSISKAKNHGMQNEIDEDDMDFGEKENNSSEDNAENANKNNNLLSSFNSYNGIKTCPATDDIGDSCCICNDPFEIFWFSEKEEWHFKDAIRFENRLYHPICFEDNQEESFFNTTLNQTQSDLNLNSEITTTPASTTSTLTAIKNEPI